MKRYRINKKRFSCFILCLLAAVFITGVAVDVVRFPEWYFSTWRYQLQCDIEQGDQEMIEYYNSVYVANERELFAE